MRVLGMILFLLMAVSAWGQERAFIYDDHGRRDPFWPLVDTHGQVMNYETELLVTDLVLEGIMADVGGNNLAIINGQIVGIGKPIGQFVVLTIKQESVVLSQGQQKFELKLKKED